MDASTIDLETGLKKAIKNSEKNRSRATAKSYRLAITAFLNHMGKCGHSPTAPLASVNIEHFIEFPDFLSEEGYANSTIKEYVQGGARFLLRWLVINGILQPTYADTLRLDMAVEELSKKHGTRMVKTPAPGVVESMLAAARKLPEDSPLLERDIALIELLASSGLRNEEATKLMVGDLDMRERTGKVKGKGDKEALIYFSQRAAIALETYWTARNNRSKDAPVFCRHDRGTGKKVQSISTTTVRDVVDRVSILAGVDGFTPHWFRHGFAITVLEATGGDLASTQDLMRHARPDTTRVYATIVEEKLKKTHRKVYH